MIKVIGDIGSCHNGKLAYAKEAIDLATDAGLFSVKFQLFEVERWSNMEFSKKWVESDNDGNIVLPREWWRELVDYAKGKIDIFASAFDEEAIQLLYDTGIRKVKLAYSQAFNLKLIRKARKLGMEIWVSGDYENYPNYADKKLFCISKYPIRTHHPLSEISPALGWNGISFHRLWPFTKAEMELIRNYEILEVHFTLDHDDIDCPDNDFALLPSELKAMMKEL